MRRKSQGMKHFFPKKCLPKKSLARTSSSPKKWRASARQKVQKTLKIRHKTNGRHCVPPYNRLEKFQKVRFWCNYTVPLELTLSKIVENHQTHPAAPRPASGASNARKIPFL